MLSISQIGNVEESDTSFAFSPPFSPYSRLVLNDEVVPGAESTMVNG